MTDETQPAPTPESRAAYYRERRRAIKKKRQVQDLDGQFPWALRMLKENPDITLVDVPEDYVAGYLLLEMARNQERKGEFLKLYTSWLNKRKERMERQKAFSDDGKKIIHMMERMVAFAEKKAVEA